MTHTPSPCRGSIKFADGSGHHPRRCEVDAGRARNPDNGIWSFTLEAVDSVDTTDTGVVLHLNRPIRRCPKRTAMFNSEIMPQKLFEAMPGVSLTKRKPRPLPKNPLAPAPLC
ncbi:MAG: hypothetical protein R2911_19125 [Caldilineaceae bacterium]